MKVLILGLFYGLVFGGILARRQMARADVAQWHPWPRQEGCPGTAAGPLTRDVPPARSEQAEATATFLEVELTGRPGDLG